MMKRIISVFHLIALPGVYRHHFKHWLINLSWLGYPRFFLRKWRLIPLNWRK